MDIQPHDSFLNKYFLILRD